MDGYEAASYGEAFADVYDDWYRADEDAAVVDPVVAALSGLAGPGGRVLELGVGTGRIAIPLARRGHEVHGLDASAAMLRRLRDRPGGEAVVSHLGDMSGDLPPGEFDLVFVAINTLFNLPSAERQRRCFAAVAERLAPGGSFVVEAFVPDADRAAERTSDLSIRSLTADRLVLAAWVHDPAEQRADGQLVELRDGEPVRLRPISIRYAPPDELDLMAEAAGLVLRERWSDFHGRPFEPTSRRHVSVYVPAPST